MSAPRSVESFRPHFAREGIFNIRDLGGVELAQGARVAPGRLIRADALQRARLAAALLEELGVVRVLDLRDEREREAAGVLDSAAIDVVHHPVLDPTFTWHDAEHPEPSTLLATATGSSWTRSRRGSSVRSSRSWRPSTATTPRPSPTTARSARTARGCSPHSCSTRSAHPDEAIVADYVRSGRATAVQVNWLWSFGMPQGDTSDEELASGVCVGAPRDDGDDPGVARRGARGRSPLPRGRRTSRRGPRDARTLAHGVGEAGLASAERRRRCVGEEATC